MNKALPQQREAKENAAQKNAPNLKKREPKEENPNTKEEKQKEEEKPKDVNINLS